jgi:hypothetical protein
MTIAALRSAQAGAILTAVGLSAGLMTGVAEAVPVPPEHNCPSPFFGDGLNERYKVSERIIGPPDCRVAFVGEKWVRAVPPWLTAPKPQEAVYPGDYVPSKPDPIADFKEKFVSARYVIDANPDGTGGQTVTAGPEILFKGSVDKNTTPWAGLPLIVPVSPVFDALPVGIHTINVFVTMSARHCNGLPPNGPTPPFPNDTPGLISGTRCLDANPNGVRYPVSDNNAPLGGNATVGLAFEVKPVPAG